MNQSLNMTTKKLLCRHTNRGGRVWLEGKALAKHGFHNKALYSVEYTDATITLTLNSTGDRAVAGTPSRPIVDLHSKAIGSMFPDGSKVLVTMFNSVITITSEETN